MRMIPLKEILRSYPRIFIVLQKFSRGRRALRNLGLMPIRLSSLIRLLRYFKEWITFKRKGGSIHFVFPIVTDYKDSAGVASGHYFHQDLLVAQYIHENSPIRHIDIGSRIDGFVAHVASFRKIEVFDIRTLKNLDHPNIEYSQVDLMSGADVEITDSLSCLHAIEHFGLGRYDDPITPLGHLLGFKNLIKMLKPGGTLYISFPIGSANEVHFNAHRVFHPKDILTWAPNELILSSFDFVDDFGNLHKNIDLSNFDPLVTYGCGIYTFRKI